MMEVWRCAVDADLDDQHQAALEGHLARLFERRQRGAITESEYQAALLELRHRERHREVASDWEDAGSPSTSGDRKVARFIPWGLVVWTVFLSLVTAIVLYFEVWIFGLALGSGEISVFDSELVLIGWGPLLGVAAFWLLTVIWAIRWAVRR
jgi:hypothetical protein